MNTALHKAPQAETRSTTLRSPQSNPDIAYIPDSSGTARGVGTRVLQFVLNPQEAPQGNRRGYAMQRERMLSPHVQTKFNDEREISDKRGLSAVRETVQTVLHQTRTNHENAVAIADALADRDGIRNWRVDKMLPDPIKRSFKLVYEEAKKENPGFARRYRNSREFMADVVSVSLAQMAANHPDHRRTVARILSGKETNAKSLEAFSAMVKRGGPDGDIEENAIDYFAGNIIRAVGTNNMDVRGTASEIKNAMLGQNERLNELTDSRVRKVMTAVKKDIKVRVISVAKLPARIMKSVNETLDTHREKKADKAYKRAFEKFTEGDLLPGKYEASQLGAGEARDLQRYMKDALGLEGNEKRIVFDLGNPPDAKIMRDPKTNKLVILTRKKFSIGKKWAARNQEKQIGLANDVLYRITNGVGDRRVKTTPVKSNVWDARTSSYKRTFYALYDPGILQTRRVFVEGAKNIAKGKNERTLSTKIVCLYVKREADGSPNVVMHYNGANPRTEPPRTTQAERPRTADRNPGSRSRNGSRGGNQGGGRNVSDRIGQRIN